MQTKTRCGEEGNVLRLPTDAAGLLTTPFLPFKGKRGIAKSSRSQRSRSVGNC